MPPTKRAQSADDKAVSAEKPAFAPVEPSSSPAFNAANADSGAEMAVEPSEVTFADGDSDLTVDRLTELVGDLTDDVYELSQGVVKLTKLCNAMADTLYGAGVRPNLPADEEEDKEGGANA